MCKTLGNFLVLSILAVFSLVLAASSANASSLPSTFPNHFSIGLRSYLGDNTTINWKNATDVAFDWDYAYVSQGQTSTVSSFVSGNLNAGMNPVGEFARSPLAALG